MFFVDAVSFLGVVAVLAALSGHSEHAHSEHAQPEQPHPHRRGSERLRWLLDLPRGVLAASALALLVGGFGLQFAVTGPLMATRIFHLGSVGFGLFGTCMAVGGIAGTYYSSRRSDPGRSEFAAWALMFGAAESLAAAMPVAWAYDVAMVAVGAATQLFAVSATVYIQQATPPAQRGHALAAYNAGFIGFVPVGAFAIAAVASTVGTRWALAAPAVIIVASAIALSRVPVLHRLAEVSRRASAAASRATNRARGPGP